MKKLCVLLLCVGSIAGCKSSTEPTSLNNISASMPADSSTFTYAYSDTDTIPSKQLTEHVTIVDTTNSEFFADLVSDTVGGFSTTSNSQILVLSDGDIQILSDDTLTLPIATHQSYTESQSSIPVLINGEAGTVTFVSHSDYLGEETISAAGQSLSCSEVSRTDSTLFNVPQNDSLNNTIVIVRTFWYSSQLGYFVKEQEESSSNGGPSGVDYTRILTAYKLGK
jgi:hypothetical protein